MAPRKKMEEGRQRVRAAAAAPAVLCATCAKNGALWNVWDQSGRPICRQCFRANERVLAAAEFALAQYRAEVEREGRAGENGN